MRVVAGLPAFATMSTSCMYSGCSETTPDERAGGGCRISLGDVGHAQAFTQTEDEVANWSMGKVTSSSLGRPGENEKLLTTFW